MASLSFTSATLPLFALLSVTHAVTCCQKDKTVLLEFKKSLNNPYALASWGSNTDCCGWYCITCDTESGRVSKLDITSTTVTGEIPDSIRELTALTSLTLRKLDLYGEISPKIRLLRNLTYFRLDWNRFSGQIPPWLSELNRLAFLDLSFNRFSGEIPSTFGQFRGKAPTLDLSHNGL
ncbi:polygalacturonase inhibitor 2-like [Amborella trichopoda]|uniref:Leucine-rich repeat-containing N-terminal plant-type domain-containing protein n=1 Tax=Amborella trichopoda TaxID=13333 RepID=W1PVG1_AMBTC|nr:polygalacturonase inhibitor 2-like [Amborella trichopoda]ERN11671.1 hypothetical protein AMTR_s00022p00219850 [Amborella trichopoda]|eukprot:XP_020526514.1 polygalacturonase inhibitor 2-like [Amborella trichopoda]